MSDPLFIAEFENGHETCTAVFCPPDSLNPERGVMLARRAFTALTGNPAPSTTAKCWPATSTTSWVVGEVGPVVWLRGHIDATGGHAKCFTTVGTATAEGLRPQGHQNGRSFYFRVCRAKTIYA
jgi:hypothetical protein